MKPILVSVDKTFINQPSTHHVSFFSNFFHLEIFNPNNTYSKDCTFLYETTDAFKKIEQYKKIGCKFINESIWEPFFISETTIDEQTMGIINCGYQENKRVLQVPKWFWYEEHFSQKNKKPNKLPHDFKKSKEFIMLIGDEIKKLSFGKSKPRAFFYDYLFNNGFLFNSLHSFLERGLAIEGTFKNYDANIQLIQRDYYPEWYNSTAYTIIVEACIAAQDNIYLTEKTMKPIMYGHPFMIYNTVPNALERLRSWGFQTFENIFNESYDCLESNIDRCHAIAKNIENFRTKIYSTDKKTIEKVNHNFNLFWNENIVKENMIKELIKPMLEFIKN